MGQIHDVRERVVADWSSLVKGPDCHVDGGVGTRTPLDHGGEEDMGTDPFSS